MPQDVIAICRKIGLLLIYLKIQIKYYHILPDLGVPDKIQTK